MTHHTQTILKEINPYSIPGIIFIKPNKMSKSKQCQAIKKVVDLVNGFYNVDLTQKTRKRAVVFARQMTFKLLRECIPARVGRNLSQIRLVEVGNYFNLDHSTVIHGIETIDNLIQFDDKKKNDYNILLAKVNKVL